MSPFSRESGRHDLVSDGGQSVEIRVIRGVLAELVLHPERHVVLGAREHRRDLRATLRGQPVGVGEA